MIIRIVMCLLIVSACAGCAGDGPGAGAGANTGTPPGPPNTAPTISGAPPLTVTVGESYSFSPTAIDAEGDTLTFDISNAPGWATFDSVTGRLTGTPALADVGTTAGVLISVSDGNRSSSLAPFDLVVVPASSGSATVSWVPPSTNVDGSALQDLAGFYVYYGRDTENLSEWVIADDPNSALITIENLNPGIWYFAVTAFDTAGNQSSRSPQVSKEIN